MQTSLRLSAWFLFASAPVAQAIPPAIDGAFVGSWSGSADIVVNWTKQRTLHVDLTLASEGTITGTIGDAEIVTGRFRRNRGSLGRALRMGTDYIVTGHLRGALVASEEIERGSFTMPLNWRDGAFAGGIHAGRSKVGGRDHMMLSATHLRLTRKCHQQPARVPLGAVRENALFCRCSGLRPVLPGLSSLRGAISLPIPDTPTDCRPVIGITAF